jgi:Gram-negative porin
MLSGIFKAGFMGAMLCVAAFAVSPAIGASSDKFIAKRSGSPALRGGIGTFTPAAADPRLAAAFARSGIASSGFRFTPAASDNNRRSVRVAVRARAVGNNVGVNSVTPGTASLLSVAPALGVNPVAYNLGVGVGWKRFALSGDVARVDPGAAPGGRESVDLGISYNASKWSTRVQLGAEKPMGNMPRSITGGESVSLDVGGSYRLTRRLDVTAGVRYKTERDRLSTPADTIRDSQAVYVGTAFRF